MERLHPEQFAMVAKLPDDKPIGLLTRHSIREDAGEHVVSYRVPLTEEGVELAKCWGGVLNRPIHRVYSSPVGRCIQTAEYMLEGAAHARDVQVELVLTEPGCFIEDITLAGPVFLAEGPVGFLNKHLNECIEGVMKPEDGVAKLLGFMRGNMGAPGELTLHITHDTVLASLVYHLMALQEIDQAHWPWMMEGAFFWFDEHQVHWLWRGVCASRDLHEFGLN